MEQFRRSVDLPVGIELAFAYHQRPGALSRLMPPWENVKIVESDPGIDVGNRVVMKMSAFGVPMKWVARHTQLDPPHLFEDVQDSGPFASWRHQHQFSSRSSSTPGTNSADGQSGFGCTLTDDIQYQVPLGKVGKTFGGGVVKKQLEAMFRFRHATTQGDLQAIADADLSPMVVGVSGAGGLVGRQLSAFLSVAGHDVKRLVRGKAKADDQIFAWGDAEDTRPLGQLDAVIHLAGESIASARWNEDVKQRIRDSRVIKTRELCERLAALEKPPKVLVCASATGIYGDRGEEQLDEQSAVGEGFLADVARQWEESCRPAIDAGIRVVNTRFGIILSPQGGAMQKMLLPTKLGVAGPLGSGKQWWAWMAIDDIIRAIYHCLATDGLDGPVNFVAPQSTRCSDFAKVLGKVLNRPAFLPAPAFALRMGLGEMADALLLASTNVVPTKLRASGFRYQFPELEGALRHLLGRFSEQTDL